VEPGFVRSGRLGIRNPAEKKAVPFHKTFRTAVEPTYPPIQMVLRVSSGDKTAEPRN